MVKQMRLKLLAVCAAIMAMLVTTVPAMAAVEGGGPWGDIDGYYTWQINGKGWTIYSQNGYSWVYDDYGNRTYLDSYGNKLDGVSAAAAKTITEMKLTYYTHDNGTVVYTNPDGKLYTVDNNGHVYSYGGSGGGGGEQVPNYVMYYTFTSADGYNVYCDDYGNYWWFGAGGTPNRYTGSSAGSYWRTDVHNYTYYYAYKSKEGYYIYRDDYGNSWWFGQGGIPHKYASGSGGGSVTPGGNPSGKPAETNVDYSRTNVLEADGHKSIVYVGQYWQAPSTVGWAPAGTTLIGWDYAEGTNYVRWKPGAWIKNTGYDLHLFPVYGSSGIGATRN